MSVHHYMVEYSDDRDAVVFANDTELSSYDDAVALARVTSKHRGSAYAVAFVQSDKPGVYTACGHVSFHDGVLGESDGVTA